MGGGVPPNTQLHVLISRPSPAAFDGNAAAEWMVQYTQPWQLITILFCTGSHSPLEMMVR